MKNIILILITTFTLSCCNKEDDNPQNPIDQLPLATQTGANTFGCLINGEPFVVTNTSLQTAIYQDGGLLIGGQKNINNNLTQVSMFISEANIGAIIAENNLYVLNSNSVPKGEYYSFTEAGNGELGFFIVSDGSGRPYKIKCRPPCFYSLAAYSKIVEGGMLADAVVTMASMNFIAGEFDR